MSNEFKDGLKRQIPTPKPKKIYTAPKGSAHRADNKRGKFNSKIAAVIAAIVVGGVVIGIVQGKTESPTLTNLIEEQQNIRKLGISSETANDLIDYEEYLENIEILDVSGASLLEKTEELRNLILNSVKEKTAFVTGHEAKDFKVSYEFSGEEYITKIEAEADYINGKEKEQFYRSSGILPTGNMPKEMFNIILQIKKLDELKDSITNNKISDKNALKELKKCFKELNEFNTNEIIKGENNELLSVSYEKEKGVGER